jgi:transketolase
MILAKTVKGKGVSFWEDKNGYHGIPLKLEELKKALIELGNVDHSQIAKISNVKFQLSKQIPASPAGRQNSNIKSNYQLSITNYKLHENVSTRKAFGQALVNLGQVVPNLVVLDGDVQNSTCANLFSKTNPDRFYQMFIAEQNMTSLAVGMAKLGFVPIVSTFAAFFARSADQIRMAHLSNLHIIFNGSHGGVSIGQDGPSQMGLEDISLFRTFLNSIVLYPTDEAATQKLLFEAYKAPGIVYIRTQRPETPVIYAKNEEFLIGGSKIHKFKISNFKFQITIIACGITVIEALKAQEILNKQGIAVDVIDCYSIKPIDIDALKNAAKKSNFLVSVEDHYIVGGLGDAVLEALAQIKHPPIYKLGVTKIPRSGSKEELFDFEGISASEIVKTVKKRIGISV